MDGLCLERADAAANPSSVTARQGPADAHRLLLVFETVMCSIALLDAIQPRLDSRVHPVRLRL